jgi:hypothetical protein
MTGNEGRDSVEQDDEHRGRGYDQLDAESSNVSSRRFAVRVMSATMVAPLRMEHNLSRMR